jgi:hypothetical protein
MKEKSPRLRREVNLTDAQLGILLERSIITLKKKPASKINDNKEKRHEQKVID